MVVVVVVVMVSVVVMVGNLCELQASIGVIGVHPAVQTHMVVVVVVSLVDVLIMLTCRSRKEELAFAQGRSMPSPSCV